MSLLCIYCKQIVNNVGISPFISEYSYFFGNPNTVCQFDATGHGPFPRLGFNNVVTQEARYYVNSLEANASKISHAIRCHWHVENSLHWIMDVTFKEDDSRIRRGVASENMSVMQHLAMNLIRTESESNFSIPRKRRKANLYDSYREKVLGV